MNSKAWSSQQAQKSSSQSRFVYAVSEFTPSVNEDLQLDVGDVIKIIHDIDEFWQYGMKIFNKESGQFPRYLVRCLQIPSHSTSEIVLFALDSYFPESHGDLCFNRGEVIVLEHRINKEWGSGRCANSCRGMFPLNYTSFLLLDQGVDQVQNTCYQNERPLLTSITEEGLGAARAIWNLTAQLDEELSFCIGDEITVLEVLEDGSWFRGRLKSNVGIFPASFVELLGPLKTSSDTSTCKGIALAGNECKNCWKEEIDPKLTFQMSIKDKGDSCYTHNEENGTISTEELKKSQIVADAAQHSATRLMKNEAILYTVTATHEFVKTTHEELSFNTGTIIPIFEEVDDHWLIGEIGEHKGFVARAYVTKNMTPTSKSFSALARTENKKEKLEKIDMTYRNAHNCFHVTHSHSDLMDEHWVKSAEVTDSLKSQSNSNIHKYSVYKKAIAVYDYNAHGNFDITVLAGEIVWVMKNINKEWVEVTNECGQSGILPLNSIHYVAKVPYQRDISSNYENLEDAFSTALLNAPHHKSINSSTYQKLHLPESVLPHQFNVTTMLEKDSENEMMNNLPEPNNDELTVRVDKSSIHEIIPCSVRSCCRSLSVESGTENIKIKQQNAIHDCLNYHCKAATAEKTHEILEEWHASRCLILSANSKNSKKTSSFPKNPGFLHSESHSRSKREEKTSYEMVETLKAVNFRRCQLGAKEEILLREQHETVSGVNLCDFSKCQFINSETADDMSALDMHSLKDFHSAASSASSFPESRKQSLIDCLSPNALSAAAEDTSTKTRNYTPSRKAPILPESKISTYVTPLMEKMSPLRPSGGPPSFTLNMTSGRISLREKVCQVEQRNSKLQIEKIRSYIEDYSRMKTDLEIMYHGTTDGKERRCTSENLEFVKANLRRLEKQLHDLIDSEQDPVYQSIDQYLRPVPNDQTAPESSLPPDGHLDQGSPATARRKRQERRLLVVSELVETEKLFLNDVQITVENFMNKLIKRQISQSTISILFANIIQVRDFSQRLLKELEEAFLNESSPQIDFEGLTVGQVFIDFHAEMKEIYTPYYRNYDDAMTHLEKVKEDEEFSHIIQQCLDDIKNKVNVFDLGSFLIKPVQRFLKYPLLIEELIRLTDAPTPDQPSDQEKLILAHKLVQSNAKDINEDKRIKDLVRKYKDAGNERISEKLGKLNLKTLKKKSARISVKLGRATGITTHETKDLQYDTISRRFENMVRATKLFIHNVSMYCDKYRDVLFAELAVAHALADMVVLPEATHPVVMYKSIAEKMSGSIYKRFYDQVQIQVLSPISSLILSFKSPQTIIDKRIDKLIDYERSQKHSDSDKTEAARHDYEALNKSLVNELPKIYDLGLKLLLSCTAMFSRVHSEFERKLLLVFDPLLRMIQGDDGLVEYSGNIDTFEKFRLEYFEAIHTIARLQVVPVSFSSVFGSHKSNKKLSTSRHDKRTDVSNIVKQPNFIKDQLRKKYMPQQLYVSAKSYIVSEPMDISCNEGDVVAVLKKNDPMGSKERWFVDRGGQENSTGFLPSTILLQFNPRDQVGLVDSYNIESLNTTVTDKPPALTRRQKSLSFTSSHQTFGSGYTGGLQLPTASHALTDVLKSKSMHKSDGTLTTNPSILGVFSEEDDLLSDQEYKLPASPKCLKQYFRAEFDFHARTAIELSLEAGNIVSLIVNHDTNGNSDWWFVSNADGIQGYVPANYLTKAEYL